MSASETRLAVPIPLPLIRRGKVRDVYEVDSERLLLVATDRVSAFDVVMRENVPCKGVVLTQLTAWWLTRLAHVVPNHLITADVDEIVDSVPALADSRPALAGRSMLVWRAEVFPVECVVRGYLAGSGWKEYRADGTLAGEPLPAGIRQSERLPAPLFTPATKAETGHDENISRAAMRRIVGPVAQRLEDLSLQLFDAGQRAAAAGGLILADTKFEFGQRGGDVILIDEVMTPDSSRLWAADTHAPGTVPPSFDKQPLRDYLERLRETGMWDGAPPPPPLPDEVVAATRARYLAAYERLTGAALPREMCE